MAVAVAVAGSGSSNSTPSLGTSICCRYGPKEKKERKEGRREEGKEGRREGRKEGRKLLVVEKKIHSLGARSILR